MFETWSRTGLGEITSRSTIRWSSTSAGDQLEELALALGELRKASKNAGGALAKNAISRRATWARDRLARATARIARTVSARRP